MTWSTRKADSALRLVELDRMVAVRRYAGGPRRFTSGGRIVIASLHG